METSRLDWAFVRGLLPTGWRELAVERGLVKPHPAHLHTKVTDIEQVLRPFLMRIGLDTSLRMATSTTASARVARCDERGAEAADGAELVDLSAPALHHWERKIGGYLAELLARMLTSEEVLSPDRWAGYEVIAADGTSVSRPGATGTTARVMYALRLSPPRVVGCHVLDEHSGESLRVFDVAPGQLWLADRCYSNPYDIAWVVDHGADIVVRCQLHNLPLFDPEGQRIDVLRRLRPLKEDWATAEWPVTLRPTDHAPIRGRVCAVRLPREATEKARARLRREGDDSARALETAQWIVVFTTTAADRVSTAQALDVYRMRWQVELEIKRDKSLGGLDRLPNFRQDTIATWLFGKLLLQQIVHKAIASVAFPPGAAGTGSGSHGAGTGSHATRG